VIAFVYGRCSVMSCSEETVCIACLFLAGSEPSQAEAIAMVMPVERGPCAQWCQAVRTGVVCRRCAILELAAQLPGTTAQDWAPRPSDLSTEATVQDGKLDVGEEVNGNPASMQPESLPNASSSSSTAPSLSDLGISLEQTQGNAR